MSTDWMRRAACRCADPELFFPPGDGSQMGADQLRAAKTFCDSCPVAGDCLQYALANPTKAAYGFWANTTPGARNRLRQRRREAISVTGGAA
jgi:WhiB family redox-sensing transcriptional regulator